MSDHEIRKEALCQYGCERCVWRLNSQCPYGFDEASVVWDPSGLCDEYYEFLLGFSVNEDGTVGSVSSLWERFSLYLARLQVLDDYKSFKCLESEIKKLEKEGLGGTDRVEELRMKKNALRLFWLKLNEVVLKGLGKVVDREVRVKKPGVRRLSVQQLNVLFKDSVRVLEDKSEEGSGV